MLANVSLGVVGGVALLQLGGYVGTPAVIGAAVYFVAAFTTASVYRSKGRSYIQQAVDIYNTGLQQ